MSRVIFDTPADADTAGLRHSAGARAPRRLLFSAIAVMLALLLTEGLLQIAATAFPRVDQLLKPPWARTPVAAASPQVLPDAVLGCNGNPNFVEHDADGFRNGSIPARADVVTLGDSQTYGSMVQREEAWPAVLARTAGISVHNLGFGAWGPWEYAQTLDRALALHPRTVIVGLYLGNDLYDAFRSTYVERRAKPWIDREREAAFKAHPAETSPDDAGGKLFAVAPVSDSAPRPPDSLRGWVSQHVRLYGLIRTLKDAACRDPSAAAAAGLNTDDWPMVLAWADRRSEWCTPFEHAGSRTLLTARYRRQALDLADARVAEGFRLTVAALGDMAERCSAADVRLVVMLIPTKETVFQALAQTTDLNPDYEQLLRAEAVTTAALRSACEVAGIDVIEVVDDLRTELVHAQQPYAISADGHPNAVGHRAIAARVARALNLP